MKVVVILMLCAMFATCVMQGNSAQDPAPAPNTPATTTVTPAGALVVLECTKTVLAGEPVVRPHHFAQIDNCVALVRAALLAR
jgi:hypothetical protein